MAALLLIWLCWIVTNKDSLLLLFLHLLSSVQFDLQSKIMSLKQQTLSGIEWSAGSKIAKGILQFIIAVILIRLLAPKDFGLVGMIMVFTGFAGLFSELGLGAALIQKKEIEEHHLSSIFWLNIATGIILTAVVGVIAPVIATFYNEPQLTMLTLVLSATFFIGSFDIVQKAILIRSMNFRILAIVETSAMLIAGICAILLAYLGFGVWSLVWQAIISTTAGVIILWSLSDWKPSLKFNKDAAKELVGFSGNLLGFNIFGYWARNIDDLLVGKVIGSIGLGIYNRAYHLMLIPLSLISSTLGQVMFPSLSLIQDDKVRVKHIYLRTIAVIAMISFPLMMGLMVVADSFVLVLFGLKWVDVIPILRIFCLIGMIQSIVTTTGWIYNSQGRTDWMFRWGMFTGTAGIVSFIIGVWLGTLKALAYCYAIANILLIYHNFSIPGKLINMTFFDVLQRVAGIFGCAVLMTGGVYLLGLILPPEWPHWQYLIIQVPFGIFLYSMLIHIFKLKAYVEVKELLWEQWGHHFAQDQKI